MIFSKRSLQSLTALIPAALVLTATEWASRMNLLPQYLVASPSEVWRAFFVESDELWAAFFSTLALSAVGFLISAVVGTLAGIVFAQSIWIKRALYPYMVFFQTVPIIAIAPLLVIWFGFGAPTILISAFIVSVFPVLASTLTAIISTEPALVDLFQLSGATRSATIWKLRLPSALPQIFVGYRIAAGLAVIGAIVGEFIAGGGLGGMIDVARQRQRIDQVFAAVLLASLIGVLLIAALNAIAHKILKGWHISER